MPYYDLVGIIPKRQAWFNLRKCISIIPCILEVIDETIQSYQQMPKLHLIKCILKIKTIRKLEIERKSLYLVKLTSIKCTANCLMVRLQNILIKGGGKSKNARCACKYLVFSLVVLASYISLLYIVKNKINVIIWK